MFILTTIDDLVEIKPEELSKSSQQIIENSLNEKYCNKVGEDDEFSSCEPNTDLGKVIQKIGLCIGVFDILEAGDGRIGHGTGIVNVNGGDSDTRFSQIRSNNWHVVLFRLVVFRPFQGEILQGKIASASPTGIRSNLYQSSNNCALLTRPSPTGIF